MISWANLCSTCALPAGIPASAELSSCVHRVRRVRRGRPAAAAGSDGRRRPSRGRSPKHEGDPRGSRGSSPSGCVGWVEGDPPRVSLSPRTPERTFQPRLRNLLTWVGTPGRRSVSLFELHAHLYDLGSGSKLEGRDEGFPRCVTSRRHQEELGSQNVQETKKPIHFAPRISKTPMAYVSPLEGSSPSEGLEGVGRSLCQGAIVLPDCWLPLTALFIPF